MKNMKKIETNTSKKPMKRLIAVWVVFVMLIVPFANHVGKNDVKADESGTGTASGAGIKIYTETPDNVNDFGDININTDDKTGDLVSPENITVAKYNVLNEAQTFFWLGVNGLPGNQNVQAYYKEYDYETSIEDIKKGIGGVGELTSSDDYLTDLENLGRFIKQSDKVAIYLCKKNEDGVITSYALYYIVDVEYVDTGFSLSDTTFDGSYKKVEDIAIQAGKSGDNAIAKTKVQYYITTENPVSEDELKKTSNYGFAEINQDTLKQYIGKTIYVYAGLMNKSGDKLYEYKPLGSVRVTNDKQAPTIALNKVEQSSDETTGYTKLDADHTDANNVYYGNKAYYRYTFEVKDEAPEGQDASGVKKVQAKIGTDGTYVEATKDTTTADSNLYTVVFEGNEFKDDKDHTIYVTATDNADNSPSEDYKCTTKIMQVTDKTTVTSVTLATDETWDGLNATETKYLPKLNKQTKILVTLQSTKKLTKITLGDGYVCDITDADIESATVERVYTIHASFAIPKDVNASETIKDLKVSAYVDLESQIADADKKTIKQITYDAVAPSITSSKIQKNVNGTGWTDLSESEKTKTELVTTHNTKYRYVVTVTDADSGVASVYVNSDETANEFKKDTTNTYTYEIPDGELNVSYPYNPPIYAKDVAGNVTEAYTISSSIRALDTSFTVHAVIKDTNGQNVTDEVLAGQYTNKAYNLEVTASSSYAIDKITLYTGTSSEVRSAASSQLSGNIIDDKNRYTATGVFSLPKETEITINQMLQQMYVEVTDTNHVTKRYPSTDGTYLHDVLYDQTAPVLTLNEADVNTWYQSYTVNYTITSGNSTTYESPLASTSYTLSGMKAETKTYSIPVDGTQTSLTNTVEIPESATITGTNIAFAAQDKCENSLPNPGYIIKIDKTRPAISFDVNGKTIHSAPIEGEVTIKANVSDNLTIGTATLRVQGPNTDKTVSLSDAIEQTNVEKNNTFTLNNILGKTAEDGTYIATVNVADKAGNSASQTITFKVDNTIPVVTAKIFDGVTAGKQPGKNFDGTDCDYFYRSNVTALLTYEDDNLAQSKVVVKDNGTTVPVQWSRVGTTNKYQATYVASKEGAHTITIGATDEAGNAAVTKQIVFIKDTAAPAITAVINGGMVYNENMGVVDLTANANVSFSVSDSNEDVKDFNYQLIKTEPDQLPVTADVIQTETRGFGYVDEADYIVKVYAIDKAGNKSAERTVQFRVDKTAPELKISGASSGATLNSGTTLTFSMTEAFWKDASGTVTITRKPKDGAQESTYKTIDFKPTARTTTMTETLSETGEYKVTFTGKDRAGHSAEAASYTVKIDTGKPVIALSGVKNNDKTTDAVEFTAQIDEDFYLTKSVSIKATRTYLDKTSYQEKTEDLQITGYNPTAATTLIRNTFTEDGIYKIQIDCKDAAGNTDTQEVSFTIDKTKPVIDAKVLAAYAGKLTAFSWDYDLDDIIYDLTVCDVHMYLNGTEYDGTSEVEDGAYELKIVAEDELGNQTEETSNFSLDTKAPTFIVTGVEDGEVKNEQYDINVSLQLEEDTLDSVSLNGKAIEIKDDAASITVTEKGDYKLTMKAHDEAGNEAEKTISFTYGEKKSVVLYVVIGVAALAVLGGGGAALVIGLRKKKA